MSKQSSSRYNIGIDTGGTYTDAVIIDPSGKTVLASAKSLTTKGDLSLGIGAVLDRVMQTTGEASNHAISADTIGLVSLSTTLATNALVEGHGSKVGVILIGFDDVMFERTELVSAIPTATLFRVAGGHVYDGAEAQPLDEAAIRDLLTEHRHEMGAWAVASAYSVRNAAHERRAQALVRDLCDCPVTASCDLSAALNGPRRALTAAFNARIIALIVNLVGAVRDSLAKHDITAPLMIVKGDGSIATADTVIEKPIETILSGPAASVIGANFLSSLPDFIISDIGGTTTDVAIVKNGWPKLNEHGSSIGGFRTMVKAIDMATIGLGGDSAIEIDHRGCVHLQANRVVPMALLGHHWPNVIPDLERSLANGMGLGAATQFLLRPQGYKRYPLPTDLSDADCEFLEQIDEQPVRWSEKVNRVSDRNRVTRLVDRGLLQVGGLTPSDAAHVLGKQNQWSQKAAELVCLMIGRSYGKISYNDKKRDAETRAFAQEVFYAMAAKSAHLLLERLSGVTIAMTDPLVSTVTAGGMIVEDLQISLKPAIPVVAVGGPAAVFYPEVTRRIGTEAVIPEYSSVANAIGAAAAVIRLNVAMQITRAEAGGFAVLGDGEPKVFVMPEEALKVANAAANRLAEERAQAMNARILSLDTEVDRLDIPDMKGDSGLISATITAECIAVPLA